MTRTIRLSLALISFLLLGALAAFGFQTDTPAEAHSNSVVFLNPYNLDATGGEGNDDNGNCHDPSAGFQCSFDIGHGEPYEAWHNDSHTIYVRASSTSSTYHNTQVCKEQNAYLGQSGNGYRVKLHVYTANSDLSVWNYAGSVAFSHLAGTTQANSIPTCGSGSVDASSVSLGGNYTGAGFPAHVHMDWWAPDEGWHHGDDITFGDNDPVDDDAEMFHLQW